MNHRNTRLENTKKWNEKNDQIIWPHRFSILCDGEKKQFIENHLNSTQAQVTLTLIIYLFKKLILE